MVRKRSRTSRKYDSSDDNFTESDYSLDSPEEPAPKKYSLRQRKKTVFIEDFDYEDAEEGPPSPRDDGDEDFEFEEDEEEAESSDASREAVPPSIPVDPSVDIPDDPDELIDFEDVIRADIVVNKHRIDYDNLISKSEIKVQPSLDEETPARPRRGRKPKKRQETDVAEQFSDFNDDDDDYVPEDFLANVPLDCVQAELQENDENDESCARIKEQQSPQQPDSTFVDNHNNISETSNNPPVSQESVIKVNPLQVNGSSFHIENPEIHFELKQESEEDDDDDVVLIEDKKCEVIVLDD